MGPVRWSRWSALVGCPASSRGSLAPAGPPTSRPAARTRRDVRRRRLRHGAGAGAVPCRVAALPGPASAVTGLAVRLHGRLDGRSRCAGPGHRPRRNPRPRRPSSWGQPVRCGGRQAPAARARAVPGVRRRPAGAGPECDARFREATEGSEGEGAVRTVRSAVRTPDSPTTTQQSPDEVRGPQPSSPSSSSPSKKSPTSSTTSAATIPPTTPTARPAAPAAMTVPVPGPDRWPPSW